MANEEQLSILKQGVKVWNKWRDENLEFNVDFRCADLRGEDLRSSDFRNADLRGAMLDGAIVIKKMI